MIDFSTIIALLSAVIAGWALFRGQKNHKELTELQKRQVQLQENQDHLAKLQAEKIESERNEGNKANVQVELLYNTREIEVINIREPFVAKDFYLKVTNHGPSIAYDLDLSPAHDAVVIQQGVFPLQYLYPNDTQAVEVDIPTAYKETEVTLAWKNADGTKGQFRKILWGE